MVYTVLPRLQLTHEMTTIVHAGQPHTVSGISSTVKYVLIGIIPGTVIIITGIIITIMIVTAIM